jgi:hypothetical protein
MKEGKYRGLEMVLFTHNNTDKTQKLSLLNYNLRESGTDATDRHQHCKQSLQSSLYSMSTKVPYRK